MPVYMIVEAREVRDKQKYNEYVQKVPQIVEKFGRKYLARGGGTEELNPEQKEKFMKALRKKPAYEAFKSFVAGNR